MAMRACVARAVLLAGAVWLAGTESGWAQAAAEAGALGAASSAAGSVGSGTAGRSLGSVPGGAGGKVNAATASSAAPAGSAGTTTTMTLPGSPAAGGDVGAAGMITVVGPQPDIHFDVASFQPCSGAAGPGKVELPADGDSVAFDCQPVYQMLAFAYAGGPDFDLTGYPSWVTTDLYDMQAKAAPDDLATWQKMNVSARKVAVRKLLVAELKLKVKLDATPKPVYTLSVAESGPKLKEYTPGERQTLPNGLMLNGKDMTWVGWIAYFQDMSMRNLVDSLSAHLDRPVVNQTGLTGSYDFQLPLPHGSGTSATASMAETMPSVAEALERLGLKLEPARTLVDGMMVEHIERPAAD